MATRSEAMNRTPVRFWPSTARTALLLIPLLLIIGLVAWALFRGALGADDAPAELILLAIVILSLIPLALLLLDGLTSSGGTVEIGEVKIALTAAATAQMLTVVPRNVASGTSIGDSGSVQIIEGLRRAQAARRRCAPTADVFCTRLSIPSSNGRGFG